MFLLPDGRKVKGHDVVHQPVWPWRASPWEPGVRYARLTATSPTYGEVTVVIVDEPGQDRYDLFHIPSNLVVDHWASAAESISPLDFLSLHAIWTLFGRLIS